MKDHFNHVKTIFIGGCPRSGTTMLGSILGSAAGCIATPESQFKQTIPVALNARWQDGMKKKEFYAALQKNFRFKLWEITVPEIDLPDVLNSDDYRKALLSLVDCYARKGNKKNWQCWIDHTPLNIQRPLILMKTFSEAKFIHVVRDPRAVAASILPLDWGPHSAMDAAHFWAQRISFGQALESAHPDKCMRVYYEDILTSHGETIKQVCDFCGIEFEENMLKGRDLRIPNYTKKQHQLVGSMPDPSRLNAWQDVLDIWQIAVIEEIVGDLMELMGYKKYFSDNLPHRSFPRKIVQKFKTIYPYLNKKIHFRKRFYG